MLRITLYKNCRLNNKYQEVFFTKQYGQQQSNTLELYLNSLTKTTYEMEDMYYENTGELVFPLDISFNIYEYNYIKIQENTSGDSTILIRYCFVKSIECKNGCVYLKYEEDIWSSYVNSIKGCQKSFLERSRLCSYKNSNFEIKQLPLEYDGNNNLDLIDFNNEVGNDNRVFCLVQIQLYNLVQGTDEFQLNFNLFMLIAPYSTTETRYDYGIQYQTEVIQNLIKNMATGKLKYTVSGTDVEFNYTIGNIYLLPARAIGINLLTYSNEFNSIIMGYKYKYINVTSSMAKGYQDKAFSIQNNFKNLYIGTFNKNIKLINNNTSIAYKTFLYFNGINFNWQIRVNNEILDITDDFKYQFPITSMLAEDFAQRKIATELEDYKVQMEISKKSSSDVFSNISDFWTALSNIITGSFLNNFSGLMNQSNKMKSSYGKTLDTFNYEIPTLNKISKSIKAPKYSNIKGNIGNSNNLPNYSGLILARINPDNENYVKETVDITGYQVFIYVGDNETYTLNDILFDTNNFERLSATYDAIKFSSANVYGNFTNDIAEKLNEILENGVKIWYSPTLQNDNITDDLLN